MALETIGLVGLGLSGIGAGVSAAGTLASGAASDRAGQTSAAYQRAGGEISAAGIEQGGVFAEQSAEFQAKGLDQAATESRAVGQRNASEVKRQQKYVLSDLQAKAAASGGGADDVTVTEIAKDIAKRGEYEALSAMYTGENQARGIEDQAAGVRYSGRAAKAGAQSSALATRFGANAGADAAITAGRNARTASYYSAGGTLLSTAGSIGTGYSRLTNPYYPVRA